MKFNLLISRDVILAINLITQLVHTIYASLAKYIIQFIAKTIPKRNRMQLVHSSWFMIDSV